MQDLEIQDLVATEQSKNARFHLPILLLKIQNLEIQDSACKISRFGLTNVENLSFAVIKY